VDGVVKNIAEVYCDFFAVNPELFTFDCGSCLGRTLETWNGIALQRCLDGLLSLCLALRKRPLIRFDRHSSMTQELALKLNVFLK
jgi:vacuolar protein sorting-associated protein 45